MLSGFVRDAAALGGLPAFALAMLLMPDRAISMVVAWAIMMAIAVPLRLATRKPRPNARRGYGLAGRIEAYAFPSVHTARATIIAGAMLSGAWMLVPGAALVASVGAGRVAMREHDWIDVVAGAALGAVAWTATLFISGRF